MTHVSDVSATWSDEVTTSADTTVQVEKGAIRLHTGAPTLAAPSDDNDGFILSANGDADAFVVPSGVSFRYRKTGSLPTAINYQSLATA